MERTAWSTPPVVALVAGGACYLLLTALEGRGVFLPVSGYSWAAVAAITVVLLFLGRSVRRLVEGETTRIDVLRAARVAMLAKACALGGAVLVGYFGAQSLLAWTNISAPALRAHALAAGAAALASVVLVVVGLVVESWCRLPPPDEEAEPA